MGDCHFYARRFAEAGTQYAQASSVDPSLGDYSLFQKGFVQGLQRNYREKIQSLNQLISTYPSSQYVDDALYEQGRAFVQLEDNANAIKRYSLLVERFPEARSRGRLPMKSVCCITRMIITISPLLPTRRLSSLIRVVKRPSWPSVT